MAEQQGRDMQSVQERVAYLEGRAEDAHAFLSEFGQRFDRIDARFERLEAKVDDHFKWLVGIQMTSLIALFGAIIGLYFK